jgi:hypothetical protein
VLHRPIETARLTRMWLFAPSWSGLHIGILVYKAGIIDRRNVSLEIVQTQGTVDIVWGSINHVRNAESIWPIAL